MLEHNINISKQPIVTSGRKTQRGTEERTQTMDATDSSGTGFNQAMIAASGSMTPKVEVKIENQAFHDVTVQSRILKSAKGQLEKTYNDMLDLMASMRLKIKNAEDAEKGNPFDYLEPKVEEMEGARVEIDKFLSELRETMGAVAQLNKEDDCSEMMPKLIDDIKAAVVHVDGWKEMKKRMRSFL